MSRSSEDALEQIKLQAAPLYSRLSAVFREMIREGKWEAGTGLPSETDLAKRYGVSVGTARKALEDLELDGWITRRQGRGTFVTDPAAESFNRFCRIFLKASGENVFSVCSPAILDLKQVAASTSDIEQFDLTRSDSVVQLMRLFARGGDPVMLEAQTLASRSVPGFESRTSLPSHLYGVLLKNYGISVRRCTEQVCVIAASPEVADLLHVEQCAPLLHTFHVFDDVDGVPVGRVERWIKPDVAEYTVQLS